MSLPVNRLNALYAYCRETLKNAGIESHDLEARRILEHRGGFTWTQIIATSDLSVSEPIVDLVQSDIEKRLQGMPLSRIYGIRQFWGLDFKITDATLDPRADTETIITTALAIFDNPPRTILDLGTGSGCLPITFKTIWPEAYIVATDVSREALQTAKSNARKNNTEIAFIHGHWADTIQAEFELITSNPPYIESAVIGGLEPAVRDHDPILALDGGVSGLDAYIYLMPQIKNLLAPCGRVLFEIGINQVESITRLVEESGLFLAGVHADLSGRPRVLEISNGDKS